MTTPLKKILIVAVLIALTNADPSDYTDNCILCVQEGYHYCFGSFSNSCSTTRDSFCGEQRVGPYERAQCLTFGSPCYDQDLTVSGTTSNLEFTKSGSGTTYTSNSALQFFRGGLTCVFYVKNDGDSSMTFKTQSQDSSMVTMVTKRSGVEILPEGETISVGTGTTLQVMGLVTDEDSTYYRATYLLGFVEDSTQEDDIADSEEFNFDREALESESEPVNAGQDPSSAQQLALATSLLVCLVQLAFSL